MIRKLTLYIGAPTLLAFIAWNAYVAVNNLKKMQKTAALTAEDTMIQANISAVLQHLTDMETGQRGYLLTADSLYLQPYNDAKNRLGTELGTLRLGLANRPENERLQVSQLESLVNAKQAEMERSINMRQQGYRHRAFKLEASNEGLEYMEKARGLLSSLSEAETARFERFDKDRSASRSQAFAETVISNLCLLLLTACLFALVRYQWRKLEEKAAEGRQELAARDLQLEKLTFALCNQARSNTSIIETSASLLLENYGGFLPRRGHEYAVQIIEASAQMERLRQDLVGCQNSRGEERAA